jgi:hypothetical protein
VKFEIGIRSIAVVLICSLAASAASRSGALTAGDKKDKAKPAPVQAVDTGSFGVFIRGQRVVTETFSVHQESGVSVIKAQLKEINGGDASSQKSSLEITSSGELLRYEWSQPSGGSLTVIPSNDFLLEKITPPNATKAAEKSFLLPATSSILDNNFFVHREVLVWRYLTADCKTEAGNLKCQQDPAQFGVLIPQDQNSMSVRLELVGREKILSGLFGWTLRISSNS